MSYVALYRKWRPLVFEDVVEQEHVVKTLKYSVSTGRIAHAYLFCGTRGTGKTTTAHILSRAINCLQPRGGNPCNECEICRGILSGTILDVLEIDAASNNSVDNIRDIRDDVVYSPSTAKYKVYIIDEVHMLSSGLPYFEKASCKLSITLFNSFSSFHIPSLSLL
jgi:DNA polymerase-3 subunit gamma/tau